LRFVKIGRFDTRWELGGTAAGDCELGAADVVLRTRRWVGTKRIVDGNDLMSKNVLPRRKLRRNIDIPSRPLLYKLRHRPKPTPRARMIRLRFVSHSSL